MRARLSFVPALCAAAAVAACGLLPPSQRQEFAVTGAPPAARPAPFRNLDPRINDVQAKAYCADGYQKLDQAAQPTDSGVIEEWRVRCTPYGVSFLPF